jgi:probable HAF family extracellular repeat protein
MNIFLKPPLLAAAIMCTAVSAARAAYTTVYLGLADPVQYANERLAAPVAASGLGIASAIDTSNGGYAGVAEEITPTGVLTLGSAGIGGDTVVNAISPGGVAVGSSGVSGFPSGNIRAVEWLPGSTTATVLGNLGLSSSNTGAARAYNVSPNGSFIAGYAEKYTGGTKVGDRAVVWNSVGTPTAGALIGPEAPSSDFNFPAASFAEGVNDSGVSVGRSVLYSGTTSLGARPVKWAADGTATQLGILNTDLTGRADGDAYDINASGVSIGVLDRYDPTTGDSLNTRAVRWNAAGVVQELGNLGTYVQNGLSQSTSTPYAINSSGVAVGACSATSSNDFRAVRWGADGTAIVLQRLNGIGSDAAYGINDNGLVVGYAGFASGVSHATLWNANNQVTDLNSLIDPALAVDFTLTNAYTISNDGWIAGVGQYDPDGVNGPDPAYTRAFLLQVPVSVPEPTSLAMIGVTSLGLIRRRRA